jgi:hypothetical protein
MAGMAGTRSVAAGCALALACFANVSAQAEPFIPGAADTVHYGFLRGSKWYVPTQTLPAIEMNLGNGRVSAVVDQTVWDVTGYRYGYFWGRTAAVFTRQTGSGPQSQLSCASMLGSVTPDGRVHITFTPKGQKTALTAVRGIGTLTRSGTDWLFQMQMSTGTTTVVAHWSYMAQCKSGQACEKKLPATNLSLSQFLAQCD